MKNKKTVSRTRAAGRILSGSGIVVLALILAYLWNGSNGGSDSDDGDNDSSGNNPIMTSTETDPLAAFQPQPESSDTSGSANMQRDGLSIAEQAALNNDVLTLLIDNYDVKLAIPNDGNDTYRKVDLQRAAELASLARGDSNGIRVRILRYGTARPTTEESLRQALEESGITETAIYMPADFIPDTAAQQ